MAGSPTPISRDELAGLMDSGADLVLVDALAPMSYARGHLPGAVNLTPDAAESLVRRRLPDAGTPVVVYCSNPECESSQLVAAQLLELGYRDVRHYAGGKDDWVGAGLPLEG